MGRGGPKPQPRALKRLHGNPGDHRLPAEPEGIGDLWSPPSWMDDEQRAQWIVGVENAPRGLLSATDLEAFTAWVCATVEYRRAVIAIREEGQIVYTAKGRGLQNPLMRTMTEQANLAFRASDRLGFSPGARASLGKTYVATHAPGQLIGTKLKAYLDAKPDKLQ